MALKSWHDGDDRGTIGQYKKALNSSFSTSNNFRTTFSLKFSSLLTALKERLPRGRKKL
jgi:hypothetical protein